jgi:hypothetical protein
VLTLLFLPALYALWFRRSLDARGTVEEVGLPDDGNAPADAPRLVPNGADPDPGAPARIKERQES